MTALLLVLSLCASASEWMTALPQAVASSVESKKPILVDFQAPWCYSCYYMEQRVLSKPGFQKAAQGLVALKLDVDTPEGAAVKAKHAVSFLPSYVLLAPGGEKEIGRIIGEQTERDFLKKLEALLGGGKTDDAEHKALQDKIGKGDLDALRAALKEPADCRTPYLVYKGEEHVDKLAPAAKSELLALERKALEGLAESGLFGDASARCADFRSGVEALADVYGKAGDAAAREKLLERAVAQLEKRQGSVGEDRNLDDDLRYFLQTKKDHARLKAYYAKLVAAYPADYVYSYRFARYLLENGDAAAALAQIEKADKLCYGANRLNVTLQRARILAALDRKPEAAALLRRDIKAGKATFPKEAAQLETELSALKK